MHSSLQAVLPPGANPNSTFSPAVRAGGFLYISGMTALNEQREIVGEGDIAAQARYIYRKIAAVLAQAGADLSQVVETVDYVTTFDGYGQTADVRREVFGPGPFPAATGVLVSGLVRPTALIEIRAVAYLG
ncbi:MULTISPECIES: RidA family protein [Bordetella]|uniref:RidA family protein n=1 Tax=Bordetella TaxID=517 RepID=UPI000459D796|nr:MULTISPECIES: RidA family protein [Bordetella]ARP77475.1 RidA family protein [Bordetella genomosp. 6]KCV61797.1 endoribonuclease L-PSP [Bordetella bronchiseptica 99-R-0433]MBN3268961.1 RidA family protein [Bordetella bronchiseptica]